MFAMVIALLATSSLTGVWSLESESLNSAHFLIVREGGAAELYDSQWYPYEVRKAVVVEDRVELRVFPEGRPQLMIIEVSLVRDQLVGKIKIPHFQVSLERDLTAQRVVAQPFPPPSEHIPSISERNAIDILGFVRDEAPRDSLEAFTDFWEKHVVPKYYMLLASLVGDSSGGELSLDKLPDQVYANLGKLPEDSLSRAPKPIIRVPWPVNGPGRELQIASKKVVYPPGYKPCCGERLYELETFRVIGLEP
jgi:hypothetical protein